MNLDHHSQDCQQELECQMGPVRIYSLAKLQEEGFADISRLPYSIRVLLEAALRANDGFQVTKKDIEKLANWSAKTAGQTEIAFKPGRVVLQDFTGVPCVVDLAAMRNALKNMGGDPQKINPQVQCDLVIDHSVQVDEFGSADALKNNMDKEFSRNAERYEFLKWGQRSLQNFRIVPPGQGIVHQVNLEALATGVLTKTIDGQTVAYPDSLVGTDSHTTMINGLGVVGWGVGGIEAEAVMLGEPIYMVMPEVIGMRLKGQLASGLTATDMVLTITEALRKKGVVGKFVEFFGPALSQMSLPNRATVANMAPEYGATMGFFPVDEETVQYMNNTARSSDVVDLLEKYSKAQHLFYDASAAEPEYSDVIELDLSTIKPCLAGPKRPQDRIELSNMKSAFQQTLKAPLNERGFALAEQDLGKTSAVQGQKEDLSQGSVVIAAITSCTNTSNPSVLIGAGLLAQKAVSKGLKTKSFVKTSLAPGSRVVTEYLQAAGLLEPLEALGFHVVGYGCTTCIGNSGPLPEEVASSIQSADLVAASVLSGNRNFEGRVNPHVKANYLASPPLVVAYALAGNVQLDLEQEALGLDSDGQEVFLKDIWPSQQEIQEVIDKVLCKEQFQKVLGNVFEGDQAWKDVPAESSELYPWKEQSTYIQNPPFFEQMGLDVSPIEPINGARVLLKLGDSITTDHISPAGAIKADSPAGEFLQAQDVQAQDFNSYGSRRGNDRIMTRGTFANIRLRNLLAPGTEGGFTTYFPDNSVTSVYEASLAYQKSNTPLIVLAGKEYGTGSSRDWAAKGTSLLGVKAVIAQSYERIHRSNLVGMGVLPLQFQEGQSAESLGLSGEEVFDFPGLDDQLKEGQTLKVIARKGQEQPIEFDVKVRIDTPVEVDYYRNGGILHTVLRKLAV